MGSRKIAWSKSLQGKMAIKFSLVSLVNMAIVGTVMHESDSDFLKICIAVLCIAAQVFVAHLIAMRISRSIVNQVDRLEKLSNGDFDTPVQIVRTGDELQRLSENVSESVVKLNAAINSITEGLVQISEGSLTYEMTGEFPGSLSKIKDTYTEVTASLRDTFADIDAASSQVNDGSMQVSESAQTLSLGATKQAAAIEDLSAQISDISRKVTDNFEAAKKTSSIVNNTAEQIKLCNEEMSRMLVSMEEINHSSDEISKIIKVIDDIAFQTNILALNAAVEAAKAGAAGKGFAVVADEVRNLAAKSAEAANQTTALIEGSVRSVDKGSNIAKATAKVLDGIVTSADRIAAEVGRITDATSVQSEAVIHINEGVDSITSVIQSNTATAEECAAASEELSGQSSTLKTLLSHFRYEGGTASSLPPVYTPKQQTSAPSPARSKPAVSGGNSDFVPLEFDPPAAKTSSVPSQIYLDDDFVNVNSKY